MYVTQNRATYVRDLTTNITINIGDSDCADASDDLSIVAFGDLGWITEATPGSTLAGGSGDDVYQLATGEELYQKIQCNLAVIIEQEGGGYDTIEENSGSYTLPANVEKLVLKSTGHFGCGNGLDNVLIGNIYANTLDGGFGVDTLVGGGGDDAYYADNSDDAVIELVGEGTDCVIAACSSYTLGENVENLVYQGGGAFVGTGNALSNRITGGTGHNTLDGGLGGDTLIGNVGNDVYRIDATTDLILEMGGTDRIETTLALCDLTKLPDIEDAKFIGATATPFKAIGNDGNNCLSGAAGNDSLLGGKGDDTLAGGGGLDNLQGGLGTDVAVLAGNRAAWVVTRSKSGTTVVLTKGTDKVTTTDVESFAFDDGLLSFAQTLQNSVSDQADAIVMSVEACSVSSGRGDDTLTGHDGIDTMVGGAGNDLYMVDNVEDVVTEEKSGGNDTIKTALTSFDLPDALTSEIENLIYLGNEDFTGKGNSLGNRITSGAGNDVLDGGQGADLLNGGAGNDVFKVDHKGDSVIGGDGLDEVQVADLLTTFSLAKMSGVERLVYSGAAAFRGTGNGEANLIVGGSNNDVLAGGANDDTLVGNNGADALKGEAGNDTLDGGSGADTLTGGAGTDAFVFRAAADGLDVITDFVIGSDKVALKAAGFAGLAEGSLPAEAFWSSATGIAHDSDDRLIYNSKTKTLYWDEDGSGDGVALALCKFAKAVNLGASDFVVLGDG